MSQMFPNLFSPLTIKNVTMRNRVFSTGHMTTLVTGYKPNEDLAAYHEARARGGAGLIIIEVAGVHPTAIYTHATIMAAQTTPASRATSCIADAVHEHGCKTFRPALPSRAARYFDIDATAARRSPMRPRRYPTSASTSCRGRCRAT